MGAPTDTMSTLPPPSGYEYAVMITRFTSEGLLLDATPLFLQRTGWTPKRILSNSFWSFFPRTTSGQAKANQIWEVLLSRRPWCGVVEKTDRAGVPYWVDLRAIPIEGADGTIARFDLYERDVSEQMTERRHLEQLAYTDSETGLLNRARLEREVEARAEKQQRFSYIHLLLEPYYALRSNQEGENYDLTDLVRQFVQRLHSYFQGSVFARISPDEFVVLSGLSDWYVQGFLTYLRTHPLQLGSRPIAAAVSGAITHYPSDQDSPAQVARASAEALQHARAKGGGAIEGLSKSEHARISRGAAIENRLLLALDRRDLQIVFQPQFDMASGRVEAAEALVRWRDDVVGTVHPSDLIPIAEKTGLIHELGRFVLERACEQAVAWKARGYPIRLSVNASAREFRDKDMAELIGASLRKTGCPPELLQIEITERFALEAEAERAISEQMEALERLGIGFALDDFGSGFASLRFLQLLPIRSLKIDRMFISPLESQPKLQNLVSGIVQFGHSLELAIVAEGVETEAQRLLLQQAGCDSFAGYLLSGPLPADQLEAAFLRGDR